MKKIFASITILLVVAIMGACFYAVGIRNVNERFGFYAEASDDTADDLERVYMAEISFNNLNLTDGSVIRALQVYVDIDKLCEGLQGYQYDMRKLSAEAVLGALKTELEQKGYTVDQQEGFLDITLEQYDSLTDLYIASGRDGYEANPTDTNMGWGFWYNTYAFSDKTIFAEAKDTIIEQIALEVVTIDGLAPPDIAFVYNYGTPYSTHTIYSDADKTYRYTKLGINIHKFVMDDFTLDRQYTIYQHTPNVVVWYLIAIFAVAVPSVAFIIYANKKKKEAQ